MIRNIAWVFYNTEGLAGGGVSDPTSVQGARRSCPFPPRTPGMQRRLMVRLGGVWDGTSSFREHLVSIDMDMRILL